ncbi:hypothetical protein QFC19_008910 [Naganishia cerealis]|uniref:Uncharacterized protein n=1 Tax=Naganishia cerealis TaxID=610337 RepID=A0ACC2UXT0_9TREE|nr:hypothetical protein QFC19_008910 [Naganishia cerealis]
MRDMACNGPFFSKILLNALHYVAQILYGVAKFSDRPGLQQPEINGGRGFLSRATTLLGSALLHPNITVVQALLLLCNSLGAQGSSTSAPILYLRIDLNQERSKDSPETIELKRRIVWAAFSKHTWLQLSHIALFTATFLTVLDKIHSLYHGRSIKFPRHDVNVSYDLQDHYEELEEWSPYAYPGALRTYSTTAYSVSTWKALCELCINVEAIISKVYSGSSIAATARDHLVDLEERLQRWKFGLPAHLNADSRTTRQEPTPMIMSFTIHVRSIAAEKQFGTSSDVIRSEVALTVCLDALEEGAKINAGVKRAQSIISSLMRVFGVASGCDMLYKVTAPFVPDSQLSNTQTVRRTISANPWGGGLEARGMDTLADTSWFLGTEDPLIGYMYNEGLLEVAPGHNLTSGL